MSYLYLGSSSAGVASGSAAGPGSFVAVNANNSYILATPPASVVSSVANGANNRVVTFTDSDSINGEANLTFDGTNLLINSTGKLYFNDAGGEYISGDANNLTSVAGTNNTLYGVSTAVVSSAGSNLLAAPATIVSGSGGSTPQIGAFILKGGAGATAASYVAFSTGTLASGGPLHQTTWLMGNPSPTYLGNENLYNVLQFNQQRTKDGAEPNNPYGAIHMMLSNSGSLWVGRGNGKTGSMSDFLPNGGENSSFAQYIGTTAINTGGSLYASGTLQIKSGVDAPGNQTTDYIKFLYGASNPGTAGGGITNGSTDANPEFFNGSDLRIKREISPTRLKALAMINDLEMIQYKWDPKFCDKSTLNRIGFSAQSCEKVYPEMVSERDHENYDFKVKNVAKGELIPVLVRAVQELSAEVKKLKNKLDSG